MRVCVFLTLLGLFVEVSESHWLLCGVRSVCHLAPWSNVTTVSTTPSAKPVKIENLHFPLGTQTERETEREHSIALVYVPGTVFASLFAAEQLSSIHRRCNVCSQLVDNKCVDSPSVSTLVM